MNWIGLLLVLVGVRDLVMIVRNGDLIDPLRQLWWFFAWFLLLIGGLLLTGVS